MDMVPVPSPELGNLVFFDHINLMVTDHRLATLFFVEGLGLTRDPYRMAGVRNMWVNVGTQQFHLPIGVPERFAGEIGVSFPDLDTLQARLNEIAPALAGTAFRCERDDGTLLVHDPWGRRYRMHNAHTLPSRNPLAIPYVEFWVQPGTAAGIAAFYRDVAGAPAELTNAGGETAAHVFAGPHQSLRFREKRGEIPSGRALHVAVYLTRFWEVFHRMEELGLLYEGIRGEQFRFCDIPAPEGGGLLYSIEHEVRSIYHLDYRRPLVNRTAMPNEPGYAAPD